MQYVHTHDVGCVLQQHMPCVRAWDVLRSDRGLCVLVGVLGPALYWCMRWRSVDAVQQSRDVRPVDRAVYVLQQHLAWLLHWLFV